MTGSTSRRDFLKHSALAGVGFWAAGGVTLGQGQQAANERLQIACIGVGGKGNSDSDHAGRVGTIVALCDIDENNLNAKAKRYPEAKRYFDFRQMLADMDKQIDAVVISAPDHIHAPAGVMAMKMKKHVYCQKPLTHSVYEARLMRETAREQGVCTQMGNQGTADSGLRRAVEIVQTGGIGPVREAHVWTNRPIWPQGTEAILKVPAARALALSSLHGRMPEKLEYPTPPKHVHWDLFLGPAPERPYAPIYHPFNWRGWYDFGTGALGDMACHTANMAFMALKLGYPDTIQAEAGETNSETYPTWARITFQFPARDELPPVKLVWYEGSRENRRILPPDALLAKVLKPGEKLADSGSLLVGDKGILFSPNDYGTSFRLLPEKEFEGYEPPEAILPRNGKGDAGMKAEWTEAIKAGKPSLALSNFDYAGPLTETILLGNIAVRVGKKVQWDGANLKAADCPEAAPFIKREYRPGWGL